MESILHEVTGDDTWIGDFNAAVITSQMIGYFVAIFIYLYRKKQYIKDNWSDAEYIAKGMDSETYDPVRCLVCHRDDLLCDLASD